MPGSKGELPRIVIDTREQQPYLFDGYKVVHAKLDAGDYSLEGFTNRVAVERKSCSDLWGSMSMGRARFTRCVERLAVLERAAIVIECTLAAAAVQPVQIQRTNVASVIGGLISWSVQHRIPVYFCDNRVYAERVVLRYLAAYYKHLGGTNQWPGLTAANK